MHTQSIQFRIRVRDTSGHDYRIEKMNPNELLAVQELLKYRSTWINMIGGHCLHNYDVHVELELHTIYVNAQLQILEPADPAHHTENMEMIIETGKRNFNHHLAAEYMVLANGDTIGMSIVAVSSA